MMTHSSRDNTPVAVEQIEADQRADYWRARIDENDRLAYKTWLMLKAYRTGAAGLYDPERLATTHEGQVALRITLDAFDQGVANARLRLAGQDRGEGWREEAERQEGLAKTYRQAQLRAEEKLRREEANAMGWKKRAEYLERVAALSTQPPPVSDVRERAMQIWADQLRTAPAGEYAARSMIDSPSPHDERAIAAISQALAHAAVGEGYAVVPRDATADMIGAALKVDWANEDEEAIAHNVWHAMVAAAPRPIQAGEE